MILMYAKIANPNSRVRLAKYYHKYQYFKAKFGYLGLNKENQPTVILFDVTLFTQTALKFLFDLSLKLLMNTANK